MAGLSAVHKKMTAHLRCVHRSKCQCQPASLCNFLATGRRVHRSVRDSNWQDYTLANTLRWARDKGMMVYAWYPYLIQKPLFESAQRRFNELTPELHSYYFLGMGGWDINCVHALSDLDMLPRLGPSFESGLDASRECLQRMFEDRLVLTSNRRRNTTNSEGIATS